MSLINRVENVYMEYGHLSELSEGNCSSRYVQQRKTRHLVPHMNNSNASKESEKPEEDEASRKTHLPEQPLNVNGSMFT